MLEKAKNTERALSKSLIDIWIQLAGIPAGDLESSKCNIERARKSEEREGMFERKRRRNIEIEGTTSR